jgi:hypothetical protein
LSKRFSVSSHKKSGREALAGFPACHCRTLIKLPVMPAPLKPLAIVRFGARPALGRFPAYHASHVLHQHAHGVLRANKAGGWVGGGGGSQLLLAGTGIIRSRKGQQLHRGLLKGAGAPNGRVCWTKSSRRWSRSGGGRPAGIVGCGIGSCSCHNTLPQRARAARRLHRTAC